MRVDPNDPVIGITNAVNHVPKTFIHKVFFCPRKPVRRFHALTIHLLFVPGSKTPYIGDGHPIFNEESFVMGI